MTKMRQSQKSEQNPSQILERHNRDRAWEYILLDLFECNQQMQKLIDDLRLNILPVHSASDVSSSISSMAIGHFQPGCEACQQFTFLSILHVLYQMEVNPGFAKFLRDLINCTQQGDQMPMPADPNKRIALIKSHVLVEPLTNRELEVLQLMVKRYSYQDIAEILFISPMTVKTHVHNVFQKLGVNRRRFAIQRAHELGLLQAS